MNEFVIKAMARDEEAFEQLVQANKTRLVAKAYSYMDNYEEASDVVQETFLKAFHSIHQLKEPKYFSTWLYKILIRESFAALKQKKRTLLIQAEMNQQHLLQQEEHNPTYDDLHEALGLLRQDYQTDIILHYFYDFKIQEIAHMTDKPINTVKIHLHRARIQLKKQLESTKNKSLKQKDVEQMLKEQLKNIALKLVTVPEQFKLQVDDYTHNQATFMWKEKNEEEGYSVKLDANGQLLSLTKPALLTGQPVSLEEKQQIAEQFLTQQYAEALDFLTLSTVKESNEGTLFKFEQFVGDYPLAGHYCSIIISFNGEVMYFNYKGYTKKPPIFPTNIAPKEAILQQLFDTNWTVNMNYLSQELYSVPASGLYLLYESPVVYRTYDTKIGTPLIEMEPYEETNTFEPFPQVKVFERETTIEKIIGIRDTMEIVRQSEIEDTLQKIVWREKDWKALEDQSMDSFISSRFEDSVKAQINVKTNQITVFAWFKERNGDLDLTFEECRNVAASFIATYYSEYVPYLQVQIQEASFNKVHRAFFTFPITVDGYRMDGEIFTASVNKTTGYIDMFTTPDLDISTIEAYTPSPIIDLSTAKQALNDVDALLQWGKNYKTDEPKEILKYKFGHHETKQSITGINAVTGELILSKL